MSKVVAGFLTPCPQKYSFCEVDSFSRQKWTGKLKKQDLQWHATKSKPSYRSVVVMNQVKRKAFSYSSTITIDVDLKESHGALFDQYLEDMPRVFESVFPDIKGSQQINEDEWRVEMIPIKFFFLTVCPVVDMRLRCKSEGRDYPPEVPHDITKVLELDMTRWELQGLEKSFMPTAFMLHVKGVLYPDRQGQGSRLKGQLEISVSFVLPPVIALIPEDVQHSVVDTILRKLIWNMKQNATRSLLLDYNKFRRERAQNLQQNHNEKT